MKTIRTIAGKTCRSGSELFSYARPQIRDVEHRSSVVISSASKTACARVKATFPIW